MKGNFAQAPAQCGAMQAAAMASAALPLCFPCGRPARHLSLRMYWQPRRLVLPSRCPRHCAYSLPAGVLPVRLPTLPLHCCRREAGEHPACRRLQRLLHEVVPIPAIFPRSPPVSPQADEELLLLEGIEIYGLGNWPKVSGA